MRREGDAEGDTESEESIYTPDEEPRELCLARALPFHYGYLVLVVCGIGLGMSGPGQTTTFGVLVGDESDPQSLMNEAGVSRSSLSLLWMVATFFSAATMLRCGYLIDRHGPMKALSFTALLLGATLGLLSLSSGPVSLFFGLYGLRLFGQGCMMLIPPYTVALWWVERRGFAYAITLSIGSIGINYAYPMLANSVMQLPGYTWRDVLRINAFISLAGTLPLGLLFYRGRPELYGLLPDARYPRKYQPVSTDSGSPSADGAADGFDGQGPQSAKEKQAKKASEAEERPWVARDALRTASLWATCGGVCVIAMISMGALSVTF